MIAISTRIQSGLNRRIAGSSIIPRTTGMIPTYVPSSAIRANRSPSALGVSTAAGISCSITTPVEVTSEMMYGWPSCQG